MGTELVERQAGLPTSSDRAAWSEDEKAVIEAAGLVFVYPGYHANSGEKVLAPRPIVARFLHTVQRTGLDPLARQIYCIPRLGKDGIEWSTQTAIDGFRVIAERSQKYAGQDAAEWLTEDGKWVPVWIKAVHGSKGPDGKVAADAHPLAARVQIYRHDWREDKPAVGIATWDEYAQTKSNGQLTQMWANRGPGQLAKCAEALALRKAFPQDLSGIYTSDEITNGATSAVGDLEATVVEEANKPAAQRSRVQKPQDATELVEATSTADEPADTPSVTTDVPAADSGEVLGGICSRCGQPEADEDGQLCTSCEVEVEREIAEEENR